MKKIPKLQITFKSPGIAGLTIIAMVVAASIFMYGSYYKNGSTALSTIVEKMKTPTRDSKYPYNYYINVEFLPRDTSSKPVVAKIKIPGATWKKSNVGSHVKIIYLLDAPTSAQLKQFLHNDMIMVLLLGVIFICISVFRKSKEKKVLSRNHITPNQRVDPIVNTPAESGKVQGTDTAHP